MPRSGVLESCRHQTGGESSRRSTSETSTCRSWTYRVGAPASSPRPGLRHRRRPRGGVAGLEPSENITRAARSRRRCRSLEGSTTHRQTGSRTSASSRNRVADGAAGSTRTNSCRASCRHPPTEDPMDFEGTRRVSCSHRTNRGAGRHRSQQVRSLGGVDVGALTGFPRRPDGNALAADSPGLH